MHSRADTVEFATALTMAWLNNPNSHAKPDDVVSFLRLMAGALTSLTPPPNGAEEAPATDHAPAVSIRKSLADPDFIISMIDGRPYKSLKRHLTGKGLTPAEYRTRYGLKANYPMVAPGYSKARSETAKRIGLGRKPGQKVEPVSTPDDDAAPVRKSRRPKTVAEAKAAAKAHLGG